MTPLSRWKLSKDEEEKIKGLFLKELVKVTDEEKKRSLLKTLLTDSEFLMLAKRLVAFVLIDDEYTDIQIAKILHITRATANRFRIVYRFAKDKKEPVEVMISGIKTSDDFKEILKKILFKYALPAAFGKIPR